MYKEENLWFFRNRCENIACGINTHTHTHQNLVVTHIIY